MRTLCTMFLACAGLLATVSPARADFVSTATMSAATDGASNSKGSGTATVDWMSASNTFTYTLTWTNLTGPATMAHIHFGAPGVDGPIVLPFFMSNMPASDTISGSLTAADLMPDPAGGINTIADVATAIENGNAYVNVHTAQYPAGEIRGQLAVSSTATPEPETTGLMLLAFAGGAVVSVRRRRLAAVAIK
ncbi:MAG: CHRD domain-containing protein [Acidobacteriota bacterium]|nr:CHRD domain-containing protein [Acidobacteriota bacterium]